MGRSVRLTLAVSIVVPSFSGRSHLRRWAAPKPLPAKYGKSWR